MNNKPKVSIIIPVYNTERYLAECLHSAVNQTLTDIEIICINDASTDSSGEILDKFAKNDQRIKLIVHRINGSSSQSRKEGVFTATGKYIMFMDSDDSLDKNACEFLYNCMEEKQVDVLQFGTYVEPINSVKQTSVEFFIRFAKPFSGYLYGNRVFDACFKEKKYRFNLWNKIYKTEICKSAFSFIENVPIPKAQDLYAYFIISWLAKSYYGIEDKFYHYRYGAGLTGSLAKAGVERFRVYCSQKDVADKIRHFLCIQDAWDAYASVWFDLYNELLNECLWYWINNIEPVDGAESFDLLTGFWGKDTVYERIIKKCSLNQKKEIIMKAAGAYELITTADREAY